MKSLQVVLAVSEADMPPKPNGGEFGLFAGFRYFVINTNNNTNAATNEVTMETTKTFLVNEGQTYNVYVQALDDVGNIIQTIGYGNYTVPAKKYLKMNTITVGVL